MSDYIDFTLSGYGFNTVIGALENLCEKSDEYDEIERILYLIENLHDQRREYYAKQAEEFKKEINRN